MLRRLITRSIGALLIPLILAEPLFAAAEQQPPPSNSKGLTVEDLTRGLKQAAHNIEQEIPKIGPAVGKTLKTMTGKGSDKPPSQEPTSGKK